MEATPAAAAVIERTIRQHPRPVVRQHAAAVATHPAVIRAAEAIAADPFDPGMSIANIARNQRIDRLGALMTRIARQASV